MTSERATEEHFSGHQNSKDGIEHQGRSDHRMGYFEILRNIYGLIRSQDSELAPHSNSFKMQRWVVIAVIPALFLFLLIGGGIDLGFNGLKPALIDSGVYYSECLKHINTTKLHSVHGSHNRNVFYCDEQLLAINHIFQMTAAMLNTSAFFVGVFLDIVGKRTTSLTALLMWVTGLLLFAFSLPTSAASEAGAKESSTIDMFVPGLVLSGVGGAMFMFVGMRFKDQLPSFPGYVHFVEATFTVVWDLSSFVFLVFAFVYFKFGTSLRVIIASYTVTIFLIFGVFAWFNIKDININEEFQELDEEVPRLQLTIHKDSEGKEEYSKSPHIGSTLTTSSKPVEEQQPSLREKLVDLLDQLLDICKQITELRSLALTFAMGMGTTLGYFYMSSLFEQLLNVTEEDFDFSTQMLNVFSILLPVLSLPETFVVSYMLHRFQLVHVRYRLLALGACIWVSLSLVHSWPYLQLLTFVLFILWRTSAFATLYACVTSQVEAIANVQRALKKHEAKMSTATNLTLSSTSTSPSPSPSSSSSPSPSPSPSLDTLMLIPVKKLRKQGLFKIDAWGSRAGLSLTVGGSLAFSIIPLNRIVMERMNGNFFIMNLSLLAVYCCACLFVEYAFHYYKTPEERLVEQYNNNPKTTSILLED